MAWCMLVFASLKLELLDADEFDGSAGFSINGGELGLQDAVSELVNLCRIHVVLFRGSECIDGWRLRTGSCFLTVLNGGRGGEELESGL